MKGVEKMSTDQEDRNALCSCGSGKKYKKCCMKNQVAASPRTVASSIGYQHPRKSDIEETFFAVSDYLRERPNPGACHLLSSILHVLLSEQGIENTLCVGEVSSDKGNFDHSWIEIDSLVFDVAIQLTNEGDRNPPIYAGINLVTAQLAEMKYGVQMKRGLDPIAKGMFNTSFVKYMDDFPRHQNGAWDIVKKLAKHRLGFSVNIEELRERYSSTERVVVANR